MYDTDIQRVVTMNTVELLGELVPLLHVHRRVKHVVFMTETIHFVFILVTITYFGLVAGY